MRHVDTTSMVFGYSGGLKVVAAPAYYLGATSPASSSAPAPPDAGWSQGLLRLAGIYVCVLRRTLSWASKRRVGIAQRCPRAYYNITSTKTVGFAMLSPPYSAVLSTIIHRMIPVFRSRRRPNPAAEDRQQRIYGNCYVANRKRAMPICV